MSGLAACLSPCANPGARKHLRARPCLECGRAFAPARRDAEFCCDGCRNGFKARRRERGAELYDLHMINRFERDEGKRMKALGLMNRLASIWREEDRSRREGRRSWTTPARTAERLTYARATIVNRNAAGVRRPK
ncbi:DNA gyrase inhibitor [Microcystis phage vB_MweS-yong2]|nr:DNA gyrase inhibitor [Microcystis phage vB_MweS-yong2]